jgi:hypothetical protein
MDGEARKWVTAPIEEGDNDFKGEGEVDRDRR